MFEVLNHLIDGRAGHMGGTAMARTVEKAAAKAAPKRAGLNPARTAVTNEPVTSLIFRKCEPAWNVPGP